MKPATIKRERLVALFGDPLPAWAEPLVGRKTGTEYEESDNPAHLLVWVEASDAGVANASSASLTIRHDGRPLGESFGAVNLVPADRPGLKVIIGGEEKVLRPGPASHHWARILTSEEERARITAALKDVPHETAVSPILEHVDVVLEDHGLADQGIRKAQIKDMPVEVIEALIATVDERGVQDGVPEWIKEGAAEHPEAQRIEAAADAKASELNISGEADAAVDDQ